MSLIVFLLIIGSAFFHALWNFAAKKASGNFYVVYLSLLIASVLFFPFLLTLSVSDIFNPRAFPYVLATGTIHAVYFFALAKAYEHGDISSAYPIARGTGVAGTALTAYFFLNEAINLFGLLGIGSISLGTLFVGWKHSQQQGFFKGLLFALLVGATITGYSIVDKLGVGIMSPVAYIFGLWIFATLWLTPYVFVYRRRELALAWKDYKKYSFIIGAGSLATYLLILFIYRIAQVSYVVALRELAVAFGAVFGFIFLGEKPTRLKIVGITLIVLGMIAIKMA
ncbi:MAG: EamA family transporter [Deltaproteobacteria bacterium]|nr:EamA family transporter [Deltaproteobacteria bacterium]